jgi:hypothetical protein
MLALLRLDGRKSRAIAGRLQDRSAVATEYFGRTAKDAAQQQSAVRRGPDRLPWPLAAPLIVCMAAGLWLLIWSLLSWTLG